MGTFLLRTTRALFNWLRAIGVEELPRTVATCDLVLAVSYQQIEQIHGHIGVYFVPNVGAYVLASKHRQL